MSWVRLEDTFPEHPKVDRAGGDAAWLHVCALAYCNRNETDGLIATERLTRLSDRKQPARLAERLVEVGLWELDPDGWRIHDYLHYQPSRASREQQRADARERMRKAREQTHSSRDVRANKAGSSPNPDPTRPDPTRLVTSVDRQTTQTPHTESSSVETAIQLMAWAIALADRDNPKPRYVGGIANNVRNERRDEIQACLTRGLTPTETARALVDDPYFVQKAIDQGHATP